jgi:hypothetical protein
MVRQIKVATRVCIPIQEDEENNNDIQWQCIENIGHELGSASENFRCKMEKLGTLY